MTRIVVKIALLFIITTSLAAEKKSSFKSDQAFQRAAEISVEVFFQKAEFLNPKLSRDGKFVAFLARAGEMLNLFVLDLEARRVQQLSNFDQYDVGNFAWVGERRLVFGISEESYGVGGAYAIDADGKRFRTLSDNLQTQRNANKGSLQWGFLEIQALAAEPSDHVLMEIFDTNKNLGEPDVFRVNTITGKRSLVFDNPGDLYGWLPDHTGQVRIALRLKGYRQIVLHREKDFEPWEQLAEFDVRDGEFNPVAFTHDGQGLWVLRADGTDTYGLAKYDLKTRTFSPSVFSDEKYDVADLTSLRWTRNIVGASVVRERYTEKWLSTELDELIGRVRKTFPGHICWVQSASADMKIVIIGIESAQDPGRYFIYEHSKGTLEMLGVVRPEIIPELMAQMTPFRFNSRDGLEIEGYVVRPPQSDGRRLPMIVNPHGGPWARDVWGWDTEAQFLASRGYAVLKVNFRGSTGYGRKFFTAGIRQWGLKMQDDITDAVNWAIEKGIADPDRIAIYGASYGGYAAMAGLVFTPELYRCGINYVGVTDVQLLFSTVPREDRFRLLYRAHLVGDPKSDAELLMRISPVNHIEKLRAPVMLAYGFRDSRVDIKHARKLIAELKRLNKSHEAMIADNEGHGFFRPKNVIAYYTRMEAFLARNMAPRATSASHASTQ